MVNQLKENMLEDKSDIQAIIKKILEYIADKEIQKGELLPSERKLCEIVGTSRGYIRKAVSQMVYDDIVEAIPQVGLIFKSANPLVSTFEQLLNLKGMDLQSLIEVRIPLEAMAASLAAKRATAEDIKYIEDAEQNYKLAVDGFSAWDKENIDFHMAIIRSSKNPVIIAIMDNLLNDAVLSMRSTRSTYSKERLYESLTEHSDIIQAIKNNDEEGASKAMRFHMRNMSVLASKLDMMVS